jgi:oxygen-independent coproporphyrinogen-3 oxidase
VLSDEDVARREAIIELSCNFRLNLGQEIGGQPLSRHFAPELEALEPMRRDGLIDLQEHELRVTDLGMPFVRNICMVFDQYLPAASAGRFSRTS